MPWSRHIEALQVPWGCAVRPHRRQDPRRAQRWATAAAGVAAGGRRGGSGWPGCSLRGGGSEEPAYNLNLVTLDPNPEEESLHA